MELSVQYVGKTGRNCVEITKNLAHNDKLKSMDFKFKEMNNSFIYSYL